jgi:hypothetical protein
MILSSGTNQNFLSLGIVEPEMTMPMCATQPEVAAVVPVEVVVESQQLKKSKSKFVDYQALTAITTTTPSHNSTSAKKMIKSSLNEVIFIITLKYLEKFAKSKEDVEKVRNCENQSKKLNFCGLMQSLSCSELF